MTSSGFISGAANLRTTVANITERDALIPSLTIGDLVPVVDDGSGSPAVYQFNGTGFEDVGGGAGATVDATLSATSTNPVENQAIVAGLALKVNIADIIDDLTSTATNQPLSAAQGKVLKDLIDGQGHTVTVADIPARTALTGLSVDDQVFVLDFNGSGNWARYRVQSTTDGAGANSVFDKLIDETELTTALSAGDVKALYESNADTNAFTDALLTKLNGIASGAEVNVQADWTETNASSDSFIQNKPEGLAVTVIGGQPMLTLVDTTRSNKVLSVAQFDWRWGESSVDDNDWIQHDGAIDQDAGVIMPFNATLVYATGHCENANGTTKPINIWVDGANVGVLGTFSGSANVTFSNTSFNIDINAGQRFRLRAGTAGGQIQDIVLVTIFKWRA